MQRRRFIQGSVVLGTGLILPPVRAFESIGRVRRSVIYLPLDAPDLTSYKRAVYLMKNLPDSDCRSWAAQARIHAAHCPHSNWWFLPWHRAFVYYFEQVCRDVLQDPSFALPYWDWTRYPFLPSPFLDRSSPLWQDDRNSDGAVQIDSGSIGTLQIENILKESVPGNLFGSATDTDDQREDPGPSTLEGVLHAAVHQTIGGFMSKPLSPQDPIFWLHHCNVDRLWESWAALHKGAIPSDSLWNNHLLHEFYDPISKQRITVRCDQTANSARFGARYDQLETFFGYLPPATLSTVEVFFGKGEKIISPPGVSRLQLSASGERATFSGNKTNFSLGVTAAFAQVLDSILDQQLQNSQHLFPLVFLLLDEIPVPKSPTTAIRVFLNFRGSNDSQFFDDPGYVATISFFGPSGHLEHHATNFSFNITSNIVSLRSGQRKITGTLDVTLFAIDLLNRRESKLIEPARPAKVRFIALR